MKLCAISANATRDVEKVVDKMCVTCVLLNNLCTTNFIFGALSGRQSVTIAPRLTEHVAVQNLRH